MQVDVQEDPEVVANAEVLEAMLAMADAAPEPGDMRVGGVIHEGSGEVPSPIMTSQMKSAGHTFVYNQLTGERSRVNNNMLPAQLRKIDPKTRQRVFTLHRPTHSTTVRGTTRCVLHPDRREPWMDAAGLSRCNKANLTSDYEMQQHAEHRHKSEWKAIKQRQEAEERREDRAARQALLALMTERERGRVPSQTARAILEAPLSTDAIGTPEPDAPVLNEYTAITAEERAARAVARVAARAAARTQGDAPMV